MKSHIQKIPMVVGIAGQPELPEEYDGLVFDTVVDLLRKLKKQYPHTPVYVLSTMYKGTASMCARAALHAGCGLIAVLPAELELYRESFEEGEERDAFDALLEQADDHYETPLYEHLPPPPAKPEEPEPHDPSLTIEELEELEEPPEFPWYFYHKQAGIYIAKHCSLLLSCWDGRIIPDEERANDYTLETMKLMQGQPFSKTAGDGMPQNSGAVLMITTPVIRAPRLPYPLPMRVRLYHGTQEQYVTRNRVRLKELRYLDVFNHDCEKHAGTISRNMHDTAARYLEEEAQSELRHSEQILLGALSQAEILMQIFIRRRVIGKFILLALLACAAVAIVLHPAPDSPLLLAACVLLALVAGIAISMAGKRRYHKKAVRYGVLVNFLSTQFFMELANIRDFFFSIPWWQRTPEVTFAERAAAALRKTNWSSTLRNNLNRVYRSWVAAERNQNRFEAEDKQRYETILQRWVVIVLLAAVVLFFIVDIVALNSGSFLEYYSQNKAAVPVIRGVVLALTALLIVFARKLASLSLVPGQQLGAGQRRAFVIARRRFKAVSGRNGHRMMMSLLLMLGYAQVQGALGWYAYYSPLPRKKNRVAHRRRSIPKKKLAVHRKKRR